VRREAKAASAASGCDGSGQEKTVCCQVAGQPGLNRQRHPISQMRSIFLGFSSVLLLGLLRLAALSSPVLDRLEVDLWPEYDSPGVLVVYRIQLPAGTPLPELLHFRIPTAAGEPSAIASEQPDGSLLSLPYDRQVSGNLSIVSFRAPTTRSQLEYYDPSLQTQGANHQFTYLWPGDYEVRDLTIQVKQPAEATEMQITPDLGGGVLGSDGLLYFSHSLGASPAGHEVSVALSYVKSSPALSFERLQPLQPIALPPPPWERLFNWPGGLGVLGGMGVALGAIGAALVVIVLATVVFLRARRRGTTGQRGKRPGRDGGQEEASVAARFCPQCGYPAGETDLYCRMCGTRLRGTQPL